MFQAGQQSGEVDTRQAAAQIAWSFEYLLFGAIAAWLADPRMDLTKRFLAAFDLAMHGLASTPRTRKSGSRRSEEHTSELQSLMRTSYAVFCLKKKTLETTTHNTLYTILAT